MKWLENSCHGIPWLIGTVAMIYLGAWPRGVELWMNLLVYLLVDIVFVTVIKAFARRRRPSIQMSNGLRKWIQLGLTSFLFHQATPRELVALFSSSGFFIPSTFFSVFLS